jgi:transposase
MPELTPIPARKQLKPDELRRVADQISTAYLGGVSIRQISREVGRSYGFVHRALIDSGVTLRERGGDRWPVKGLSPEEKRRVMEQLSAAYCRGDSINEIARDVGWSYGFVRQRLIDSGVRLRPPYGHTMADSWLSPEEKRRVAARIAAAYRRGDSIRKIAMDVGRSYTFVRKRLIASGVSLRGHGGVKVRVRAR